MNEYSFSYRHNGKSWSLNFYADSMEDAQRKLQSIKTNAKLDGEIVLSVAVPTFMQKVLKFLGIKASRGEE